MRQKGRLFVLLIKETYILCYWYLQSKATTILNLKVLGKSPDLCVQLSEWPTAINIQVGLTTCT